MLAEVKGIMSRNNSLSQTEKADLFEGLARQVSEAHPGWQAARSPATDGSIVFAGENIENALVVRPDGKIFQSNPSKPPLRINFEKKAFDIALAH